MRKKTTMGFAIATILIAYISALTFSNQAFAQATNPLQKDRFSVIQAQLGISNPLSKDAQSLGKVLTGHDAQLGKVLTGHLGDVCLSCFGH